MLFITGTSVPSTAIEKRANTLRQRGLINLRSIKDEDDALSRFVLAFALLGCLLAAGDNAAVAQSLWNPDQDVEVHGFSSSQIHESASGRPSPRATPPSSPQIAPSALPDSATHVSRPKNQAARVAPPGFERTRHVPLRPPPFRSRNAVISISNDALKPFLHFTRKMKVERAGVTREEVFHEDGSFDNVFIDDQGETTVTLMCNAAPYPNKDLNKFNRDSEIIKKSVRWIRDGTAVVGKGDKLRIENATTKDVGEYRCVADSIEIDTVEDTYPRGSLISDAMFVRPMKPPQFEKHPASQVVSEGNSLRMECSAVGDSLPAVRWLREDLPIDLSKFEGRLSIYSIKGESVLHLRNASISDEGRYRCVGEPKDFEAPTESRSATIQVVTPPENATVNPLELISANTSVVEVNRGKAAILECLTVDMSVSVFWRRTGQKTVLAKTTSLVLKGFSEMAQSYECVAMPGGVVLRTVTIKAIERPVLLGGTDKSPSLLVASQGAIQRLECNVISRGPPEEVGVRWFLNGKHLLHIGRISIAPPQLKLSKTGHWVHSSQLVLSDTQLEDEGLYQCIAENRIGQSTFVFALEVHSEANERIEDLTATVDHKGQIMKLRWKLPPSLDFITVHHTTFFLSYYLTDGSGKANRVELERGVQCTAQGICETECCSNDYMYAHSNYTIQMSMMEGSKMSPLSDQITITTYDAIARHSGQIDTLVNGTDILVTWEQPSEKQVQGVVQEYTLEYFAASPRSDRRRPQTDRIVMPLNQTSFTIENVTLGSFYKVRMVPVTRAGLPPSAMLRDHYTWARVHVPSTLHLVDNPIAAPAIDVVQQNNNAIVDVNWPLPESKEIRFVKVTYTDITDNTDNPRREVTVPVEVGTTRIVDNLELDQQYAICSEYISASGVHSFRRCHYTYLTVNGQDPDSESASLNVMPKAIKCDSEENTCWCAPSDDKGEATRVFWSISSESKLDITYVVHYALDEMNMVDEPPTHETKSNFADIPDLLPNTTYRVMIESRASRGRTAEGSWFNCKTAEYEQLPYPLGISYAAVNATAVHIEWVPQSEKDDARFAEVLGYSLLVYHQNNLIHATTISGRNESEFMMTGLKSDREYQFQLSSRTEKPRMFGVKSPLTAVFLSSKPSAPLWYHTNQGKIVASALLGVSVLLASCVFCGLVVRTLHCKRRKVESAIAEDAEKNAIEMQVIPPRVDPNRALRNMANTMETVRLLDEETEGALVAKVFDEKGGELGAQPSGRTFFEKLLEDGDLLLRGLVFASAAEYPEDVVIVHESAGTRAEDEFEKEPEREQTSAINLEMPESEAADSARPFIPVARLVRAHSCDALPLSLGSEPKRASSKSTSLHSCGISARLFVAPVNDAIGIGGGAATASTSGTSSSPHHSPTTVANFTSSLPNLNDSGIVYDSGILNNQSHHLSLIPSNPPPAASSNFFCHLQANSFTHFTANHHTANPTES